MDRENDQAREALPPSARTRVRRNAKRARYDHSAIDEILAEAFICHIGYQADGYPCVLPTAYGVADGVIYLHGSTRNQALSALRDGAEVCVTVTLVDGLVLARAVFRHSMNYRSVVIFGRAREVIDEEEKLLGLRAVVEHICPGRWEDARKPSAPELRSTLVLAVPLVESSAKIRVGPPHDQEEDLDLGIWAGELPMRMAALAPVAAPDLLPGLSAPPYVLGYTRPSPISASKETRA